LLGPLIDGYVGLYSAAVLAALRRFGAIVAIVFACLSATVGASVAAAAPTAGQLSSCVANLSGVARPAAVKRAVCAEVISELASVGARLGLAVIPLESEPGANGFQLEFAAHPDPGEPAAKAGTDFNGASPCYVQLFPRFWKSLSSTLVAEGRRVLTHEVVHCYQNVVFGTQAAVDAVPNFILEGSAEYLADDAVGYAASPSWWLAWFNPADPQPSLLKRSYDALGWYALTARVTGSLWPRMVAAWRAYRSAGSEGFIHALGADAKKVEMAWGPSLVNRAAWGSPWISSGPGLAAGEHSLGVHRANTGKLQPWAGEVDNDPPGSGRLVLIRVSGGYGAVHDESGHRLVGFVDQLFCTDTHGCPIKFETCDNGTKITVPRLDPRYTLVVSSGSAGGEYTVAGYSNVNLIAANVSPCDPDTSGVSQSALEHYAANPCELLSGSQVQEATDEQPRPREPAEAGEPAPATSAAQFGEVALASPKAGLCEWNLEQPIEQDFLIAQAAIQEKPWLEVTALSSSNGVVDVHGLGEDAVCNNGAYVQGLVPALYIELNSDWYLGVSGGHSCGAVIQMGRDAYAEVEGF
jgi:hypothetical protein